MKTQKTNYSREKLKNNYAARNYLLISFFLSLASAFCFVTYIPFLVSHDMNLWQINVINSFFMATIILTEMPTGSFADKFGRHRSFTLSCFILALSYFIYQGANNFWVFISAEVIAGIGKTFASGALEAWMVDSLIAQNKLYLKQRIFNSESYFVAFGTIIGSLSGAYVGDFNLSWPWFLGGTFAALLGLYSLTLRESDHETSELKIKKSFRGQIKNTWQQGFANSQLTIIMILGATLALAVQAINMQWTVFFQGEYRLETKYLGWIFVAIALTQASGASLVKFSLRFSKSQTEILALTQILTAVLVIILTLISGLAITLSFFLLHEVGRGIFKPLKQSFFNDHLISANRATSLSLDSMINKIGSLVGLLISGFIAETWSIKVAWLSSGVFLLLSALWFIYQHKKSSLVLTEVSIRTEVDTS